jgi:putative ABC transport system ATP-binding protein
MKIIEAENLTKTYQMGEVEVNAVKNLNLEIEKGSFVSVMGPSGSGKSTLMHLLGLLDMPTDGELVISGRKTSDLNERHRAEMRLKRIGLIFQFYSLLTGFDSLQQVILPQMLDNVKEERARDRAKECLKKVGLGDRIDHKPSELSGGQRQRVAVARALAGNPNILLADESTSQLDTETSKKIMELYRDISNQGKTVITVNHEEELGEMADRKIWLEDGKLKKRNI